MPGHTKPSIPAHSEWSWSLADGCRLVVFANLSDRPWSGFGPSPGRLVWSEGKVDQQRKILAPWSVVWSMVTADDEQETARP